MKNAFSILLFGTSLVLLILSIACLLSFQIIASIVSILASKMLEGVAFDLRENFTFKK